VGRREGRRGEQLRPVLMRSGSTGAKVFPIRVSSSRVGGALDVGKQQQKLCAFRERAAGAGIAMRSVWMPVFHAATMHVLSYELGRKGRGVQRKAGQGPM